MPFTQQSWPRRRHSACHRPMNEYQLRPQPFPSPKKLSSRIAATLGPIWAVREKIINWRETTGSAHVVRSDWCTAHYWVSVRSPYKTGFTMAGLILRPVVSCGIIAVHCYIKLKDLICMGYGHHGSSWIILQVIMKSSRLLPFIWLYETSSDMSTTFSCVLLFLYTNTR